MTFTFGLSRHKWVSGHFVTHIYLTSARIILTAVGAVNMFVTLCCSITRKNAPASGVPTGLPYEKMNSKSPYNVRYIIIISGLYYCFRFV